MMRDKSTQESSRSAPRVHYATFTNEDTGEKILLYLYSREEIDAEIDQRICIDHTRTAEHEAKRATFHAALVTAQTSA
jgi:hypothetical protein